MSAGTKQWKIMYCPGTGPRFGDRENFELWNFVQGSFHVLGYAMTLARTASLIQSNWNSSILPEPLPPPYQAMPPQPTTDRVLIADATISQPGQNNKTAVGTYNFTSIVGGYRLPHTSPHLAGRIPLGGNVGMKDGHGEWRKFRLMEPRTTGGAPVFWW